MNPIHMITWHVHDLFQIPVFFIPCNMDYYFGICFKPIKIVVCRVLLKEGTSIYATVTGGVHFCYLGTVSGEE